MTDPIRIYCDDPEYSETWIDFSPRWTQGDVTKMLAAQNDDFYSFLRSKVVACHIQTVDGGAITDPAQISDEGLVDVDVLLFGWLGAAMPRAIAKRRALGNASARLSLPNNGTVIQTAPTMTAALTSV